MIFLGNAASFHLKTWRDIYALCGESPDAFYSIHSLKGHFAKEMRVTAPAKPLAYTALGLRLRALPRNAIIHAHGASGYGLAALLSGRRYIVTVYGSEILRPHSAAYLGMIRAVLRGAAAITVTSAAARDRIAVIDIAAAAKTYFFHTGIDTEEAVKIDQQLPAPTSNKLHIMLLRNAASHYRTREVLSAIEKVIGSRRNVKVTIPFGNGDLSYFADTKAHFCDPRFHFLEHPLDHNDYLRLIAQSNICVNFPLSDQVSTTLIEALYFDRVVVTNRLTAYADLLQIAGDTGNWFTSDDEHELPLAMACGISHCETSKSDARKGRQLVIDHFSMKSAARSFYPVLERVL